LIEEDRPSDAISLIEAVREAGGDARTAICDTEFLAATLAVEGADPQPTVPMLGAIKADEVCTIADELIRLRLWQDALSVVDTAREAAIAKVAAGELSYAKYVDTCDSQHAQATAAAGGDFPAGVSGAWDEFVESRLLPMSTIVLFCVLTWLVLVLVARLLAQLWSPAVSTTSGQRRASAWAGSVLGLAAPVVAIWFTTSTSTGVAGILPAGGQAVAAIACAIAAVALLSFAFSSMRRVQIDVVGNKDNSALPVVAQIQAILNDIGGESARGLEMPTGPDLADIDVTVADVGNVTKVLAVVRKIWAAVTRVAPWHVLVNLEDQATMAAYQVRRNGHLVSADRVSTQGEQSVIAGAVNANSSEKLATFIVGRLVAELAEVYPKEWRGSLHGATSGDSIALQYLATKWHSSFDYRQSGIDLLARALDRDPANKSAQVALWNLQFRHSNNLTELKRYNDLVLAAIADEVKAVQRDILSMERPNRLTARSVDRETRKPGAADVAANDLLVRLLITQGSLARNMHALGRGVDPGDLARAQLLLNALSSNDRATGNARRRGVARVNWSRLSAADSSVGRLDDVEPDAYAVSGRDVVTDSDPADGSPAVAYSLACHIARSHSGDARKLFDPESRFEWLLTIAFTNRDTRLWAAQDPELSTVRDVSNFETLVGTAKASSSTRANQGNAFYTQAKKVDPLGGFAREAARFVGKQGFSGTEALSEIDGSLAWDRLIYELYNDLVARGFRDNPERVNEWLKKICGITPTKSEPGETGAKPVATVVQEGAAKASSGS
jgi:hypothetical protein